MIPSKSKPQKNNHDFKEKYSYVHVGTLASMCITDILINNSFEKKIINKYDLFRENECCLIAHLKGKSFQEMIFTI